MPRRPLRYAPFVYGVIQAAITTAVAAAIAIHRTTDFGSEFLVEWFPAWGLAWVTMLPVVIFISPLIQRFVVALTQPAVAGD